MRVGDTATLKGTFNNLASESWSTDNASVATIETTTGHTSTDYSYYYNVVTAKGNGTAHITHTLSSFWGDPTTETWTITVGGSGGGEQTAASVTYILYVGNSGSGANAGVEVVRTTLENVSSSDLAAQKLKKSHDLANEIFGASVTGKEGLLSSDMYSESPTWSGSGPYTVQI